MNVRYRVTLTTEERQQLELLVRGGTGAVRTIKRAQILLAADAGSTDEAIAQNVGVGTATVYPSVPTSLETVPPRYLSSDGRRMVPQACPSHPKFQVEKAPPPGASASNMSPA